MKRHRVNLTEEKHILVNMILDGRYLQAVRDICHIALFETSYSRIVARWVWEYYNRVGNAPGKDIQDIYLKNKTLVQSEDDLDLIGDFLASLNEYAKKYKINNLEYEVQKAEQYFKLQSLEKLSLNIQKAADNKNPQLGEKYVAEYKRIEKPSGEGVDVLLDPMAIVNAFDNTEERLFKLPGVLGESLGYFCRGDFWAVLAPQKTGKTFWLWEIARAASGFGHNAIFFSLEMTRNQMLRRAWKSFMAAPWSDKEVTYQQFKASDDDKFVLETIIQQRAGIKTSLDAVKELQKKYYKYNRGALKIEAFPAGAAYIESLETCLTNLEYYDNFIPDIIVIDYADLIKTRERDYRHRLNDIWVTLRGWAQKRNCVVVTASQTSKKAFGRDARKEDVAEDARKLATVTNMFALNNTDEEIKRGLLRVEPLLQREGQINTQQVVVAECRDIGRIYLDSRLKKDVIDYENGSLELLDEE